MAIAFGEVKGKVAIALFLREIFVKSFTTLYFENFDNFAIPKNSNTITVVKFNDFEWLQLFRNRQVMIAPGDAIKAKIEIIAKYNFQGEVISTQYTIQKVIDVIPLPLDNQQSIFPNDA